MKKSISVLLLLFSFSILNAQKITTLEKAKEIAQRENKMILMVFQGSDWCAPCMKLKREIFTSINYQNYAKKNIVMLSLDFPRKKKNSLSQKQQDYNNSMAEKYNRKGHFPLVVVLNAQGEVLKKMGYTKSTPKEFIKNLETLLK